jgi:CubicO group peptidase (beta-lactamase class C family)
MGRFLHEDILQPLGMRSTLVHDDSKLQPLTL